MIVCDGCGKELRYVGQVHEILHDISDRFPELCGYGIKIKLNSRKWKNIYIKRLMLYGLTLNLALDNYLAGCPHDLSCDPEQSADDEASYMASDG